MICGLDEAGRGAVLGPLVVAGVCFSNRVASKLSEMGVRDSKLLTQQQRVALFSKIIKLAGPHKIIIIPAIEIDKRFSNNKNLNTLEVDAFKQILKRLGQGVVYIDSVLRDTNKLRAELQKVTNAKLVVEHKADLNYSVVGAASIIAKVTRDRTISHLEKQHNLVLGSGYPSDPITIEFIGKNVSNNHWFVRKSWAAYKRRLAEHEQQHLSQ